MYRIKKIMQKLLLLVRRAFHCVRTRSIKAVFKKHWHKVLSVVCAVSVVAFCFVSGQVASAGKERQAEIIEELARLNPAVDSALTVLDSVNLVFEYLSDVYQSHFFADDTERSPEQISARAQIIAAWKFFVVNSGITEEQFSTWWDTCINDLGLTDERLIYIEETVRYGFLKDQIIGYCFYGDGDGISISENGTVQATGSAFKDMVSDYNSRYAPMPTQSMWKWSYQTELSYKPAKSATPYIPIYWSNYGAWGGKDGSWKECYVLPFLTDDDVDAPYYMNYYYHFYPTFDDDHTPYINVELYSLMDNQLYTSDKWQFSFKSGTFDGKTAVLALNLLGYRVAPHLYGYTSDVGYLTDTTESGKFTYSQISRNSGGYSFSGGALTNLTLNKYLNNLISESTFTPDTATGDDWGAYISQTPFQLWGNQTTVDWDRVPDNYYITIEGDNFYDYTITDPDSGKNSSFGDYLIDYDIPDLVDPDEGDGDNSGGSGGKVSGDVNVGGKVDVSGDVKVGGEIVIKADPIEIKTDPIEINVNVNSSGGSSGSGGEAVEPADLSGYLDNLPEQTDTMNDYLSAFFSVLPPQFLALLLGGISIAVLCRVLGR